MLKYLLSRKLRNERLYKTHWSKHRNHCDHSDLRRKEIDIKKFDYPRVEVTSWRQIIGEVGRLGSFQVMPKTNKDVGYLYLTIKEYPVYVGDEQKNIRKKAKALATRFNKNLRVNWNNTLLKAFTKLLEYYEEDGREVDDGCVPLLKENIAYLTKDTHAK